MLLLTMIIIIHILILYTAATIHTRNGLMMTVSKRNNQSKTQSSLLSSSTGTIANTKEETKI